MTDQRTRLEHIDRFANLSDDEVAQIAKAGTQVRLECLHFTRTQVEELGARIPAFREALEAAAAERCSPPA